MVNFGTYLRSFRNPSWADEYLSYEVLKGTIYAIERALSRLPESARTSTAAAQLTDVHTFERELHHDLDKINSFYERTLDGLRSKFVQLQSKVERDDVKKLPETDYESLRTDFHVLYVELSLLRDYSSLNYTGFSKILKKHDKMLPMLKMKRDFFKKEINRCNVFGTLDELRRLQTEALHMFAEHFCGFNRLDAEISFGEALAKATEESQRASGGLVKNIFHPSHFGTQSLTLDTAGDHLLLSDHMQGYFGRKEEDLSVISSALWQRARVTVMAVQALRPEPMMMPIITSLLLMFIGGCGQAFCLEYMVKMDPGCGATITFFQFLFVSLEGVQSYLTWDSSSHSLVGKLISLRLKPLKIPLKYHVGCVLTSWFSAVLSSWAYWYNVSVPFHMVFKSSILLVNMMIGAIIMRRRYALGQVGSVLMVTVGVMILTFAALPTALETGSAAEEQNFWTWVLGVAILATSLIFTGFLGILQDLAYKNYGNHWQEALFYAHFLGLPLFLSIAPDMIQHMKLWSTSNPTLWVVLLLNTLASFMGVRGMYSLTSLTSSLTGNLTITVRKFLSLILSVVYFDNVFGLSHWTGAILVLLGTVLYTGASQQAAKATSVKKQS